MRVYIIGNDGITLCRKMSAAVNDGEIAVAASACWRCGTLCPVSKSARRLPTAMR